MRFEQRASPRDPLALPIVLGDGSAAITRDISAGGMYLLAPAGLAIAPRLLLDLEVQADGLRFTASAEVLRVEPGPRATGIALRLHAPRLSPLN